jgi:hypothetical protein
MGAGRGVLLKNWPRKDSVGSVMRLNRRWRLRSSPENNPRLLGTRQDTGPGDERRVPSSDRTVLSFPSAGDRLAARHEPTGSRVLCPAAWQEEMDFHGKHHLAAVPADMCRPGTPWLRQSPGPLVVRRRLHRPRPVTTDAIWAGGRKRDAPSRRLTSAKDTTLHQGRESAVQRLGNTAPETTPKGCRQQACISDWARLAL